MPEKQDMQDLDRQILDKMRADFREEALDHLDQLNLNFIQLEGDTEDETLIDEICRSVHTIKGSAAFAELMEISNIARTMETYFRAVRKGTYKITDRTVDVMYQALDILTGLIEENLEKNSTDIEDIISKIESIPDDSVPEKQAPAAPEPEKKKAEKTLAPAGESNELLNIYKESYDQIAALKHIVYSSVSLSDPDSLALLFSSQIAERLNAERNAVWFVEGKKVVEIAQDGMLILEADRRTLDLESSEVLHRVINEQLVAWPSSLPEIKQLFPDFEAPTLFPIKAKPEAYGFFVIDPEALAETEVYQFIGQFAAMILNISRLHQKVEEQRRELDEMTEILIKQNTQLSSIYHVELEMMQVSTPEALCELLTETLVDELDAANAAAFLIDESEQEIVGVAESGKWSEIIGHRLPVDEPEPIKYAIESGRVVSYRDYSVPMSLGPYPLENWFIFCIKGKEHIQGILVTELKDNDVADAVSILGNYSGIIMDYLLLEQKAR